MTHYDYYFVYTLLENNKKNRLRFRILYVALHNVNIYSTGSSQIINAELINVLNDDIVDINNANVEPDLRLFALKLLQSLIRGVCTKTAYDILNDNVSMNFGHV